jgi:uncharacterized membrane protein
MSGRRALMWAAAPAIALYAFHNWDLLVVAATTLGLWLWWRGHPFWAAVAYGVGATFKWYPAILIVPLVLEAWQQRDFRRGWRLAGAGAAPIIAINLPIAYINPPSWWITYDFHSKRGPNIDSLWALFFDRPNVSVLNAVTTALILASFAAILWWSWRRTRAEGAFPILAASASMVAAFLLWNKVQSPQYTLWILPFLALLDIRPRWWVFYSVVDLVAYVAIFRYFNAIEGGVDDSVTEFVMIVAILARTVLLVLLTVVFARASEAPGLVGRRRPASQKTSHPAPIVSTSEI